MLTEDQELDARCALHSSALRRQDGALDRGAVGAYIQAMRHFIRDPMEAFWAMREGLFSAGIFLPEDIGAAFQPPAGWVYLSADHERDGDRWTLFAPRDPVAEILDET